MPTTDFPDRRKQITFDFVTSYEFSSSWEEIGKGDIQLPKKINAVDKYGKPFPLFGTNKNVGGFSTTPLILRGDRVTIDHTYNYWDKNLTPVAGDMHQVASGFISKVHSGQPIKFEIEDNMWLLKQIACGEYDHSLSLEANIKAFIAGTGLTVSMLTDTSIVFDVGQLVTNVNETVAQFLARLKKDFFLESYFRGDELRIGSIVYIEGEAETKIFEFQNNILDDPELEYSRKDDLVLSAVACNEISENTGGTTADGHTKTRSKRIEVFVSIRNDKEVIKVLSSGERPPEATEGERLSLKYPWCKTTDELAKEALTTLRKGYYTGFRGSFTTFGTPFVKHGDNVQLINPVLPEQNGTYKAKAVKYSGGVGGMRQEIKLHYKI